MKQVRVACLGLSANPPHLGHLRAAEALRFSGRVDQVWYIPVYRHPFRDKIPEKDKLVPWEHRLIMCRLIENIDNGIWTSAIEGDLTYSKNWRGGVNFTVHTLEDLREKYPCHKFFWAIGSDIFIRKEYAMWHRWSDLENEEMILVIERPLHLIGDRNLPKPFVFAGRSDVPCSSTMIREMIRAGTDISKYTGTKISDYIYTNKLYR